MKKLFLLFGMLLFTAFTYAQTNNVLLEVWTGTWCQFCPCGHAIVNTILTNRPNTLVLEYHGGNTSDPWINFNGNSIIGLFNGSSASYPGAVIGRRSGPMGRTSWAGQVYSQGSNYPAPISLSFTKTWNSGTRQLTINATATSLRQIDTNVNICFVLTESNLVYYQQGNGTDCIGGSNYIHKYVVRSIVNGTTGDVLSTGSWANNTVKTKSVTTTVDASWNESNLEIGVFAYYPNTTTPVDYGLYNYVLQTAKSGLLTGIENNNEVIKTYELSQNYPNPFNPTTNIKFSIPKDGNTSLKIYDVLGNEVMTYFNTYLKSGIYNVVFEGAGLSSGVYFYKLVSGNFSETKRMIITK